jgi:hypothetical protein
MVAQFLGSFPTLLSNIKTSLKKLICDEHTSLLCLALQWQKKRLMTLTPVDEHPRVSLKRTSLVDLSQIIQK